MMIIYDNLTKQKKTDTLTFHTLVQIASPLRTKTVLPSGLAFHTLVQTASANIYNKVWTVYADFVHRISILVLRITLSRMDQRFRKAAYGHCLDFRMSSHPEKCGYYIFCVNIRSALIDFISFHRQQALRL